MLTTRKQKGNVWMTLFASVFLIAGLLVAFWGVVPVFKYLSASGWEEVDAYMINVEQVISSGDDSTSYGVKGRYGYHYRGLEYQSSQLNFYSGTDNIGDYQQQFYSRLKRAHANNDRELTAWVNPDAPENAYLDRTIRFGLMAFMLVFGLVFASAGAGVMFFSRNMAKRSAENTGFASLYPKEPWRWRKEWEGGEIKTNAGMSYKTLLAFSVIWNLISMPIAAVVYFGEESHPLGIKLLILIFPLAGLYLIHLAYRAYRTWQKHGKAILQMEPAPFSIGSNNAGVIKIPAVRLGDDFILTLSCNEKTRRRSGKRTRIDSELLWQGDRRVKARPGSDGIVKLEYAFSIPENLPESMEQRGNKSIEWLVAVKGVGDTKLELEFEVPGFVSDRSSKSDTQSTDDLTEWNEDNLKPGERFFSSTTGDWTHLGVSQRKERGGTHYYFPPARNLKITLGFPIFGLVFLATGIGLYLADAGLLFGVVFGGVGLLFTLIGLHGLFFRSEVLVADGLLYVRNGLVSMSDKAVCRGEDIREFDISSNMRSGNTRVYRLSAVLQGGEKVLLGKNLLVKSDVESLVNQIHLNLGLPLTHEKTD